MRVIGGIFVLICATVLMLTLTGVSGCGGGESSTLSVTHEQPGIAPMHQYQDTPSSARPLAETLALVESAPSPADVDPALFAELQAELVRVIKEAAEKSASLPPSGERNEVASLLLGNDIDGYRLEWSYLNVGDYNLDSLVGINDLTPIGQHYNAIASEPGWLTAQAADGNGDGMVSINDITPIGQNYQAFIAGFNIYGADDAEGSWTLVGSMALDAVPADVPYILSYELAARDFAFYRVVPVDGAAVEGAPGYASMPSGEPALASVGDEQAWETASIGAGGGTLMGPDEGGQAVTLEVPADSLTDTAELTLGELDGTVTQDGELQDGRFIYVSADDYVEFDPPAVLSVPYSGSADEVVLGFRVLADGSLAPFEPLSLDQEVGLATFQLNIACPFAGEHSASADPTVCCYTPGGWFMNQMIAKAVQDYAYCSSFRPHLDGFTTNDVLHDNKYFGPSTRGLASFAIWYYRNYRNQGRFAERFTDPQVQRLIGMRAMESVLMGKWEDTPPQSTASFNQQQAFRQVKAAIRRSHGPVLVIYQEQEALLRWVDFKVAYGYTGDELLIYEPQYPGKPLRATPLETDHLVLLVDTDRYANYEHFENILLDATADPPFGGSSNATITITSHSSGEEVQDTEVTIEGYITSGDTLVNELHVWNTWQPLDSMVKTIVSEAGDFSVPVQLAPGENNLVLLTRGLSYSFVYRGGGLMVGIPNNLQSGFILVLDDELPAGQLRFDVEFEAIDKPIKDRGEVLYYPQFLRPDPLKEGTPVSIFAGDGSLDAEPYALGEDLTKYDAEGEAASGKYRFTASRIDPGQYWIQATGRTYTWGDPRVKVTRITVAGIVSGVYEMQNGIAGINRIWIGVRYDTATGDIEVIDEDLVF